MPAASSRSHLAMDTLAVRLTLPLAGCVEDLHLLVSAPCQAHQYEALGIAEVQPPPGISDSRLVQIYPKRRELKKFDWPTTPFTNGGPNGVGYLLHRWRQGEKVSMVTKDGFER